MSKIDKYGECPNCQYDWSDGEMLGVVSKLEVFAGKSTTDLRAIAGAYGWTPENRAKFSNVVTISIGPSEATKGELITYFQCPGCKHLFNSETGEKYESLIKAKYSLTDNTNDHDRSNDSEFLDNSEG